MPVRCAVTDLLCNGLPRTGEVARQLGMSERTLQRHLAEHGQSFQALVNEVRREVAESLLSGTENSLSEVAFLTGFSDQAAQECFKLRAWSRDDPRQQYVNTIGHLPVARFSRRFSTRRCGRELQEFLVPQRGSRVCPVNCMRC